MYSGKWPKNILLFATGEIRAKPFGEYKTEKVR